MRRQQFPITSEQFELLLAFEKAGSLERLSEMMAKDSSVISRRLQSLAHTAPVLSKVSGRWQITFLGRKLNELSQRFLQEIQDLLKSDISDRFVIPNESVLISINTQNALHYSNQGRRNNLQAEENISKLLRMWRRKSWPIIHVKHISPNQGSLFYSGTPSADFIPELGPLDGERIVEKQRASAFASTNLHRILQKMKAKNIVLVGFTAGDCIDATAKQAKDMGYQTFVVADATATFDIVSPNNKLIKAEKIHQSILANIHATVAEVIDTTSIIN